MSPRPRRSEQKPNLQEAIKETAWKQIAEFGASTMSLRAIARELRITAPAIYNYYPSRDDLVTALIVDAFNSLADSQEAALENNPEKDFAAQLAGLGLAYRKWAITYPQRYQLIFGTPIPHYHAPDDKTAPAATRALGSLIHVIHKIISIRHPPLVNLAPMTPQLTSMLKTWQNSGVNVDVEVLYLTVIIWSRVHGLVLLEIGNQFPPFITEPGELFRREIESIIIQYQLGDQNV